MKETQDYCEDNQKMKSKLRNGPWVFIQVKTIKLVFLSLNKGFSRHIQYLTDRECSGEVV